MFRTNQRNIFDLHTHTTCSDGTRTPLEQVLYAKKLGLPGIGITDHDTVLGLEEAKIVGEENGIKVIPGVEISSVWNGKDIHVLGYFMNYKDPSFINQLEELRSVRGKRNDLMIAKLNNLGIPITMKEVIENKKDQKGNVGRPHIADVLIKKGIVSSLEEAFHTYLGRGGAAYVNIPRISPHEAVQLILKARGVPVLAHPGLYEEDQIIEELVEIGLVGIEAEHADHSSEDVKKYREIGMRYQLILTAGSDYHGERNGTVFHAPLGSHGVTLSTVQELEERGARI